MPVATVTWTNANPVTIDWGDGTPAVPGPSSGAATHNYATAGPKTVTITDTVTGLISTLTTTCPPDPVPIVTFACQLSPPNPEGSVQLVFTGGPFTVDWGDGIQTGVTSPATHAYLTPGPNRTVVVSDPAGIFGPATRNVSCPRVVVQITSLTCAFTPDVPPQITAVDCVV